VIETWFGVGAATPFQKRSYIHEGDASTPAESLGAVLALYERLDVRPIGITIVGGWECVLTSTIGSFTMVRRTTGGFPLEREPAVERFGEGRSFLVIAPPRLFRVGGVAQLVRAAES
jgi:hypothetical protein